ncbi:hypothetical protein HN51_003879 [Arachis hypogaea]|uniref:NTF2 domain-containing protein n=1 Tax=Arachis hypogaea TaxID=3818 RepID=A0A445DJE8_ARAHY|nr:Nuclear transport factor [Arachis hypogaea]RYR63313.1 hypothetical protein Ahy_A04g021122 [Arachis hypogaea]
MDADALAKAFVEHYYTTFDNNDAGLVNLYQQDSSMLTFEGQKIQGAKNIAAKLTSLPFNQCVYSITTVDCQPSSAPTACLSSLAATSSSPASNTLSSSAKCSICYQHHREAAMFRTIYSS